MKRTVLLILALCVALVMTVSQGFAQEKAEEKKDPLAAWKANFDPSGAEFTYILSNISHPVIEGVGFGYRLRDRVWEDSKGRLYVDFRPLAQLGGEKDVINKLKLGAVHGMLSSSVAAANVTETLGIVNLPYVVDTFDKLDKFRNTPELWQPFVDSTNGTGIMTVDITGYGPYGWATTTPVKSIADAKAVNFRIAEAPVNTDFYKAWGFKFTIMPWPDVPQALQTGVITGLDHTAIVCNITKKFTVAKHFTELDYAQGLFVHLVNKRWFDKLPADLQKILLTAIEDESAKTRELTRKQHDDQIAKAKADGVTFHKLSDADRQQLIDMTAPVFKTWGEKIGIDYFNKVRATLSN